MRVVVAGLGVQGYRRRKFAGADYVASVDPVNPEADYVALPEVPLDHYDAVLACVPDHPKRELLSYCIAHGKHVLVEKPLWVDRESDLLELERKATDAGVVIYTAYNHRFEPHYVRMRDLSRPENWDESIVAGSSMATARRVWCGNPDGATRGQACCRTLVRIYSIPAASGLATSHRILRLRLRII